MAPHGGALEVALEARHVHAERAGEVRYLRLADRRLLLVEPVVQLPEAPLFSRRFGRAREQLGARMRPLVGEVAEHVGETLAERLAQAQDHRPQTPAIGTEVVGVENQAHRAARRAATHVVAFRLDSPAQSAGMTVRHAIDTNAARPQFSPSARRPGVRACAMASIRKEFRVTASSDRVWDAFRDTYAVHTRLAQGFVTDCRREADDRVVTFANGLVARELIVDVDDARRRLAYSARSERLAHHSASFQVFDGALGDCVVVWVADVLPHEAAAPVGAMMDAGIAAMRKTLERHSVPA